MSRAKTSLGPIHGLRRPVGVARAGHASGLRYDAAPTGLWVRGQRLPGVVRFRDPRHSLATLAPFPGYDGQPAEQTLDPASASAEHPPVRPGFADVLGKRVVRVAIEPGTSLYGTGEQAGPLLRNGTRKVCWNTDAFGYSDQTPSLYQSHPWILAVRADGTAFGVLVETTWRCELDLASSDVRAIVVRCEGPSPAVVVIDGPSVEEVLGKLSRLTGTMPMPPLWALGYQQCRWSYEPESRVRELAAMFRERRIPCDVLWLDIDYMDRYRCFTFDREKFPDPAALNDDLHTMGFRTVWMIDPGLAVDASYSVYAQGRAAGHFVTRTSKHASLASAVSDELAQRLGITPTAHSNQTDEDPEYHGRVWPGACAFPDFTKRSVRAWWAGLYGGFVSCGVDGVWNDMNEPAVFDGPGKSMPDDNWHDADPELGGPGPHAKYHNVYGMLMVRATREGIAAANPDKRPFVLTRANFLGGHRYAATWTGDNLAQWSHLRWSVSMILNLGLSGQPFAGPDIGGFGMTTSPEMFAKWFGVGAMLPFARGHKIKEWGGNFMADHEPWSFGETVEATCRRALERRYRLLPYLYTLFENASRTGLPIARPVFMANPADPRLRGVENAFLLGADVLVHCPTDGPSDLDSSPAPVPAGWREFTLEPEVDPLLPRLFLRPGAILPVGPVLQHTGEQSTGEIDLLVCPGAEGLASGEIYQDAGDGFGFQKGEYRRTRLSWRQGGLSQGAQGEYDPGTRIASVRVL